MSSGLTLARAGGLVCSALLCLCLCVPAQALAQDPSRAQPELALSISRILSLIRKPDYANPATRGYMRRQIEDEVYHIFDFEEFSARTVGQPWRSFTPAQREAFTAAFADLLFSTYLSRIDSWDGEKVSYTGERRNEKGTRVEVQTEFTTREGRIIPVAYRMMPRNGNWMVYDVFVEGVSLVRNYRTQFQEILSASSPDELTRRVRERAVEAGRSHGAQQ